MKHALKHMQYRFAVIYETRSKIQIVKTSLDTKKIRMLNKKNTFMTLDFIHVKDISNAVMLLINKGIYGEIYNIGNVNPIKIPR